MIHSKTTILVLVFQLLFVFCLFTVDVVLAGKRKKKGATLNPQYFSILKWMSIALFGPVLVWFIYSLVRDPALPGIMKELGKRTTEKYTAYLGPSVKYKKR